MSKPNGEATEKWVRDLAKRVQSLEKSVGELITCNNAMLLKIQGEQDTNATWREQIGKQLDQLFQERRKAR